MGRCSPAHILEIDVERLNQDEAVRKREVKPGSVSNHLHRLESDTLDTEAVWHRLNRATQLQESFENPHCVHSDETSWTFKMGFEVLDFYLG